VSRVISKGGKLPVDARRIEGEEARTAERQAPRAGLGQGRQVAALADSIEHRQ
jgi:hypothetical protein